MRRTDTAPARADVRTAAMQLEAHDDLRFAAACLRGAPSREIRESDVKSWLEAHLLLPIADALGRRETSHGGIWPEGAGDRIAAVERVAAATDAAEQQTLREVLATLRSLGLGALLLKGVALGHTVYRRPWLRARSDIDLLVPAGSIPAIAGALGAIGFAAAREVTHPLITRQRHFTRGRGVRAAVDVHETLVNPVVLRTLPGFDELWRRARPLAGRGPGARVLSTPDALLHALVHRVAHHNSSIDGLWLYDMHLLVAHMEASEWGTFAAVAENSRVCRIAADGLEQLRTVFGTSVPEAVRTRLRKAHGEESAALLGGTLTELRLQWINFASLPGVRERAAFLRAHLLPPVGELQSGRRPQWRLPTAYVGRALHGVRKWLQPISQRR